jgi:hypothetical protein
MLTLMFRSNLDRDFTVAASVGVTYDWGEHGNGNTEEGLIADRYF